MDASKQRSPLYYHDMIDEERKYRDERFIVRLSKVDILLIRMVLVLIVVSAVTQIAMVW